MHVCMYVYVHRERERERERKRDRERERERERESKDLLFNSSAHSSTHIDMRRWALSSMQPIAHITFLNYYYLFIHQHAAHRPHLENNVYIGNYYLHGDNWEIISYTGINYLHRKSLAAHRQHHRLRSGIISSFFPFLFLFVSPSALGDNFFSISLAKRSIACSCCR
jgi:hypothetical protein